MNRFSLSGKVAVVTGSSRGIGKSIARSLSDAGAKVLYDMMSNVRKERTGTTRQGKQINPNKYIPQTGIA